MPFKILKIFSIEIAIDHKLCHSAMGIQFWFSGKCQNTNTSSQSDTQSTDKSIDIATHKHTRTTKQSNYGPGNVVSMVRIIEHGNWYNLPSQLNFGNEYTSN